MLLRIAFRGSPRAAAERRALRSSPEPADFRGPRVSGVSAGSTRTFHGEGRDGRAIVRNRIRATACLRVHVCS